MTIASAIIGSIFLAAFLWERNKVDVDQALLDEDKVNQDLKNDNAQIANNQQQLDTLEQQRKQLGNPNATPQASITDITKWFNRKQ